MKVKESPTIYIIIPVYNAEEYITRCLESIKNQTYKNFVCVIVDDGSTDNSAEICRKYMVDNHFVLLSQENHGCWFARNTGLDYILKTALANDFLTFLDADDSINPLFFERFVSVLDDSKFSYDTIYLSGYNEIIQQKKVSHKLENQEQIISGDFLKDFEKIDQFMQTIWANFYSINLIREKNLKFKSNMQRSEDINFNFTYAYYVKNYVFLNECFYNYYVLPQSISHSAQSLTEDAFNMKCISFEKRVQFLQECDIKNKEFIINKHLANLTFRHILAPQYKYLYRLKKYALPNFTRNSGQKRVIFCLRHNLLWIYRLYLKIKNSLKSGTK